MEIFAGRLALMFGIIDVSIIFDAPLSVIVYWWKFEVAEILPDRKIQMMLANIARVGALPHIPKGQSAPKLENLIPSGTNGEVIELSGAELRRLKAAAGIRVIKRETKTEE